MSFDKNLFLEDLQGVNGKLAQDMATDEVKEFLDLNFRLDRIKELNEAIDDWESNYYSLESEKLELRAKYNLLQAENESLKLENTKVGNLLDNFVIEQGLPLPN